MQPLKVAVVVELGRGSLAPGRLFCGGLVEGQGPGSVPWAVGAAAAQLGTAPEAFLTVLCRLLRVPYKTFSARPRIRRSWPDMSLESLFQHILFTEHQAEESRRAMREGRGPALGGMLSLGAGYLDQRRGAEGRTVRERRG